MAGAHAGETKIRLQYGTLKPGEALAVPVRFSLPLTNIEDKILRFPRTVTELEVNEVRYGTEQASRPYAIRPRTPLETFVLIGSERVTMQQKFTAVVEAPVQPNRIELDSAFAPNTYEAPSRQRGK